MATELIINASLPETRIALLENGEIQEMLIERASGKGIVGNIYKGRVTRVLPGMQAAFVDIGLEKAAFLYVDDVYVHSEIWEEEEAAIHGGVETSAASSETEELAAVAGEAPQGEAGAEGAPSEETPVTEPDEAPEAEDEEGDEPEAAEGEDQDEDSEDFVPGDPDDEQDEEEDEDEDDEGPVGMGPGPEDGGEGSGGDQPSGTVRRESSGSGNDEGGSGSESGPGDAGGESGEGAAGGEGGASGQGRDDSRRRRHRRGRRGGRQRRRTGSAPIQASEAGAPVPGPQGGELAAERSTESAPQDFQNQLAEEGATDSDRSALVEAKAALVTDLDGVGRPDSAVDNQGERRKSTVDRADFNQQRGRDRRIRTRTSSNRGPKPQVNIQDLLKEGQEVIVQVAKDPIATKGARLTCHISLPGRHLVCMPTIDHVGVSRRIERDEERRRLRDFVERNRPKKLGFIVRTASGKQSERRIEQDIEYLTRLWSEIREKAANVTAPALVYEDLNSVLRAIRDWVTEDIDKIVVDSRYHFNEMQRFVSHFMPSLKQKLELYHGDVPIFDAYGISTELSRALERKVWLKSGGYIVVDQAEALVAIDVNTGRYVGKKNLEDTILKTNLEAVQEIAYQLRLRNCGGIIILDLIDMEKEENKHRVYRALEEALKKDRARPTILKISELGLVEMTRKRTRDTMVRALCESCTHCEGKGFVKGKQTVAYEVLREIEREGIEKEVTKIMVQAHPDVIDMLAIDERETLDQLERRYRKLIYLQAVTDFHPEQFEIVGDKVEGAAGRIKDRSDRFRRHGQQSQQRSEEQRGDRDRGRGRDRDRNRDKDRDRDRDRDRNRSGRDGQRVPSTGPVALPRPLPVPLATPVHPSAAPSGEGAPLATSAENPMEASSQGLPPQSDENLTQGAPRSDDFFDEEDRLAFLRAQAAQDAALARLRSSEPGAVGRPAPGGGPNRDRNRDRGREQGEGGGRDRNRRRRGKKGGTRFGKGGPRPEQRTDQRPDQRGPEQRPEPRVEARPEPRTEPRPPQGGGEGGGPSGSEL
ncbi:MAG: Rne/Rng family ribonuclease [Oligoflexia bacterium]|nr:Rne/Rng family ribonuclease [Oligoflexia bacterium]